MLNIFFQNEFTDQAPFIPRNSNSYVLYEIPQNVEGIPSFENLEHAAQFILNTSLDSNMDDWLKKITK